MNADSRPGLGRRLSWVIKWTFLALVLLALLLLILGGLGWGGWLGVQELQRSFTSLSERIDVNGQNIATLTDIVESQMAEGNPGQQRQIDNLLSDLEALENRLDALQTDVGTEMAARAERITELEADLATAVAQTDTAMTDIEALQTALVALQTDLNDNSSQIDELGGEVDRLRIELGDLNTTLTAMATAEAETAVVNRPDLQQIERTLFRTWELIMRARLRLLEDEPELAADDVSAALFIFEQLPAFDENETAAAAVQRVRTRLSLALDSLPDNAQTATSDLEAAWSALDDLLAMLLRLEAEAEAAATETPVEATPTP